MPQSVLLVRGSAAGVGWCQFAGRVEPTGAWWARVSPSETARLGSPPAQGGIQILGHRAEGGPQIQDQIVDKVAVHLETPVVDVLVTMQLKLLQSMLLVFLKCLRFSYRQSASASSCVTDWVPTVQIVLKTVDIPLVQFCGKVVVPVVVQRLVSWSRESRKPSAGGVVDVPALMQRRRQSEVPQNSSLTSSGGSEEVFFGAFCVFFLVLRPFGR